MKRSDWEKISAARKLLSLDDTATLKQIKKSFRQMCKKHHPDLADVLGGEEKSSMPEINDAYNILLQYCNSFSFPLTPEALNQPMEAEDWWMDRFGQDPLWGKKQKS